MLRTIAPAVACVVMAGVGPGHAQGTAPPPVRLFIAVDVSGSVAKPNTGLTEAEIFNLPRDILRANATVQEHIGAIDAFVFGRCARQYASRAQVGSFVAAHEASWDVIRNLPSLPTRSPSEECRPGEFDRRWTNFDRAFHPIRTVLQELTSVPDARFILWIFTDAIESPAEAVNVNGCTEPVEPSRIVSGVDDAVLQRTEIVLIYVGPTRCEDLVNQKWKRTLDDRGVSFTFESTARPYDSLARHLADELVLRMIRGEWMVGHEADPTTSFSRATCTARPDVPGQAGGIQPAGHHRIEIKSAFTSSHHSLVDVAVRAHATTSLSDRGMPLTVADQPPGLFDAMVPISRGAVSKMLAWTIAGSLPDTFFVMYDVSVVRPPQRADQAGVWHWAERVRMTMPCRLGSSTYDVRVVDARTWEAPSWNRFLTNLTAPQDPYSLGLEFVSADTTAVYAQVSRQGEGDESCERLFPPGLKLPRRAIPAPTPQVEVVVGDAPVTVKWRVPATGSFCATQQITLTVRGAGGYSYPTPRLGESKLSGPLLFARFGWRHVFLAFLVGLGPWLAILYCDRVGRKAERCLLTAAGILVVLGDTLVYWFIFQSGFPWASLRLIGASWIYLYVGATHVPLWIYLQHRRRSDKKQGVFVVLRDFAARVLRSRETFFGLWRIAAIVIGTWSQASAAGAVVGIIYAITAYSVADDLLRHDAALLPDVEPV